MSLTNSDPEAFIDRAGRRTPPRRGRRRGSGTAWTVTVLLVCAALAASAVVVSRLLEPSAGHALAAGCRSTVTLTVAAAPNDATVLTDLAQHWSTQAQSHNGVCERAAVIAMPSARVASAIGPSWDRAVSVPPDVWLPDSGLWLSVAASRPDAAALVPTQPRSVASSPVVLAVRQPVAQALGWPQRQLSPTDVIGAFAEPDTWKRLGHPEWSSLRIGMSDPSTSTVGLASVLTVLDPDASGSVTDAQLLASIRFSQTLGAVAPDTTTFLTGQAASPSASPSASASGSPNGQPAIAAFSALESDVASHDAKDTTTPLVPVYLPHPVVADYPYAVLNATWVDAAHRTAATDFLQYLLSPEAQSSFAAAGLRSPDRAIGTSALLTTSQGFRGTIDTPRPTPSPAALSAIISQWTEMQRPANVLVALDTSGSMDQPVSGTGLTRLQLLQQTAITGFSLLTNQTSIGLWSFSTPTPASQPSGGFRQLVSYGPIAGTVGSVPRKQAMITAVSGLHAGGFTPLYDTVYAAFHEMQARWQPNTTNVVLLVTDGVNETTGGLTLQQLTSRLISEERPGQPAEIISIAVGTDADAGPLEQIAKATGGRAFIARDPAKAVQTLILAFAGRLT